MRKVFRLAGRGHQSRHDLVDRPVPAPGNDDAEALARRLTGEPLRIAALPRNTDVDTKPFCPDRTNGGSHVFACGRFAVENQTGSGTHRTNDSGTGPVLVTTPTLAGTEKSSIEEALRVARGRVAGPFGAATR